MIASSDLDLLDQVVTRDLFHLIFLRRIFIFYLNILSSFRPHLFSFSFGKEIGLVAFKQKSEIKDPAIYTCRVNPVRKASQMSRIQIPLGTMGITFFAEFILLFAT